MIRRRITIILIKVVIITIIVGLHGCRALDDVAHLIDWLFCCEVFSTVLGDAVREINSDGEAGASIRRLLHTRG